MDQILNNYTIFLVVIFLISSCQFPDIKHKIKNEAYYNNIYCERLNGKSEFVLDNNTRVDCYTKNLAIETDWAKKWYEGITQGLYYAMKTKKQARLLLIIKSKSDYRFYRRARRLIKYYELPIELDTISTKF